jgi:hypothetical protein
MIFKKALFVNAAEGIHSTTNPPSFRGSSGND